MGASLLAVAKYIYYISVALSFENVCEIRFSDEVRKGLEKWLAANVYK